MFRFIRDQLLTWSLRGLATISGLIAGLILVFVVLESAPAFSQIGPVRFFTDSSWHPAGDSQSATFNLLPILCGTILTSAGALALAAPLGILSAVFAECYAPWWLAVAYRRMVGLMAGIPSVVYGLWGLMVLVPIIGRWQPPGSSLLAAIVILALMIVPTIALLSGAALAAVPREFTRGAAALGLARATIVFKVSFPVARRGLIAAILLALARAIGETMAVLMVCGNVVQMPASLFDPVRTLTSTIALEMGYAESLHRSALFTCGGVLLVLVIAFVAVAELFGQERHHAAD